MTNGNELATTTPQTNQVQRINPHIGERGIEATNFEELWKLATAVAKSGFAPRSMSTTEAVFVAMGFGMELGLSPMAALRGIAVINGKPTIYGDIGVALVLRSGELEYCKEHFEGDGEKLVAICEVKRKNKPPKEHRFSWAEAKAAGLAGKDTYRFYPRRMLMWRPRSWCFRDEFADVLQGLAFAEEMVDVTEAQPQADSRPRVSQVLDKVRGALPETDFVTQVLDSPASDGQQPADVAAPVHNPDAPAATMTQASNTAPAADPSDAEDAEPEVQTFDDLKRCVDLLCGERGLDLSVGAAAVASWLKLNTRKGKPPTPHMYNDAWEAAQEGRGVFAGLAEPAAAT